MVHSNSVAAPAPRRNSKWCFRQPPERSAPSSRPHICSTVGTEGNDAVSAKHRRDDGAIPPMPCAEIGSDAQHRCHGPAGGIRAASSRSAGSETKARRLPSEAPCAVACLMPAPTVQSQGHRSLLALGEQVHDRRRGFLDERRTHRSSANPVFSTAGGWQRSRPDRIDSI